jgi:hypothetical protein
VTEPARDHRRRVSGAQILEWEEICEDQGKSASPLLALNPTTSSFIKIFNIFQDPAER